MAIHKQSVKRYPNIVCSNRNILQKVEPFMVAFTYKIKFIYNEWTKLRKAPY